MAWLGHCAAAAALLVGIAPGLSAQARAHDDGAQQDAVSSRTESLEWVQRVDSTWNGQVIGVAVGVAVTALMVSASDEPERGWLVLWLGSEIVVGAAYVGGLVDALHNQTVYRRPVERRITLAPIAAQHRVGVLARFSF